MNVKGRRLAVSPTIWLSGLAVLFLLILSVRKDLQTSDTSLGDVIKINAAQELGDAITQKFVPVFSFIQQSEQDGNWILEKQLTGMMPFYGYYLESEKRDSEWEHKNDYLSLDDILLAEAQEGSNVEHDSMQSAIQIQEENNAQETQTGLDEQQMPSVSEENIQDLLIAENEAVMPTSSFVRHELQGAIDLQSLSSYETLVEKFYAIDSNTMAGSDQLDATKLSSMDMTISKESDGPQILIYHTHSQEAFSDSVPGDESTSIVGVGEHLSEILRNEYGYEVLHHTGQYDVEARDDAYSKSLPEIEKILEENPSIQVVIDLHRDQMPEETKLVMDLDGRPTARFMFFNGLSRTRKTGDIAYLYNENQENNLAFSFQMQLKAAEYYPGLARKIYLKGYRYNMHLCPRTTLIELGAQNNTVEEAMNACDPLAHIIDMVLTGDS